MEKGIVMDGRDIGTVVFPNAELKIFVTADPQVRANRRLLELQATNPAITLQEVAENLQHRDLIDSTRAHSPLKQAHDALVLDNTNLDRAAQFDIALNWAKERIALLNLGYVVEKTIFRSKNPPRTYTNNFYYPKEGGIGGISEALKNKILESGSQILLNVKIIKIKYKPNNHDI